MNCYNCGKLTNPPHKAINCPELDTRTRCPSCHSVGFSPESHKHWCSNKTFKSRILDNTVFELTEFLQIDFRSVHDELFVKDVDRDVQIQSKTLWLSSIDAYIARNGTRSLLLSGTKSMERRITVLDQNEKAVLSIEMNKGGIKINDRYELYENGWIALNIGHSNHIETKNACRIKIQKVNEVFKVRLRVLEWNATYTFDVYPKGPSLQDLQYTAAQMSLQAASAQTHTSEIVKMIEDIKDSSADQVVEFAEDDANKFVEVDDFVKIEFLGVLDTFLIEKFDRWVEVGSSHIWLPSINTFIAKDKSRSLMFIKTQPMKRSITVYNKYNKGIFSIDFDNDVIKVNDRYELHRNGWLSVNSGRSNDIETNHVCGIKVQNVNEMFKVRMHVFKWDATFKFDVYPIGPIFQDPLRIAAQKSLQGASADADSGAIVKY